MRAVVEEAKEVICALARVEPLRVLSAGDADTTSGVSLVVNPLVVRLPLQGVDLQAESDRLHRELESKRQDETRKEQLLANPNFVSKARAEVVENERQRLRSLTEERQRIEDIIAQLGV